MLYTDSRQFFRNWVSTGWRFHLIQRVFATEQGTGYREADRRITEAAGLPADQSLRMYRAPQYGHMASPGSSIGR